MQRLAGHAAIECQQHRSASPSDASSALQVGKDLISLITSRANIDELLKLDDAIDLVIPRGSNALVSHIQQNTKIAVLGHADGICHIYVDPDCDIDMACKICVDSKIDYPAACNAVEKVLVHESLKQDGRVSNPAVMPLGMCWEATVCHLVCHCHLPYKLAPVSTIYLVIRPCCHLTLGTLDKHVCSVDLVSKQR